MSQSTMAIFYLLALSLVVTATLASASTVKFTSCDNNYCFHSNGQPFKGLTIFKASQECQKMKSGSWPLEIYDQSLQDSVMNYVAQFTELQSTNILLNLKRIDNDDWKWSTGRVYKDELSIDGLRIRVAHKNGPFSTLRNLPYRIIIDDAPQRLNSFFCSYPFNCSANRTAVSDNNVCYSGFTDKSRTFSWFEAYNYCYRTGGSLATLADMTPATLQIKFRPITTNWENYWIGLFKNYWGWQHNTGSTSNFTNWYNGFPIPSYFKTDADRVLTFFRYVDGGIWMDTVGNEPLALVCMTNKLL